MTFLPSASSPPLHTGPLRVCGVLRLAAGGASAEAVEIRCHQAILTLKFPELEVGEGVLETLTYQGEINNAMALLPVAGRGRDGREAVDGLHAVRGAGRAPRLPVLGRAQAQGHLHPQPHDSQARP